ncbi:hypothetical protein ACOMHN_045186 [Nucella lapillus]
MEGSSGSEDSSESACLTDGSEYIPDSESSSEPVELLPVIFNPVSATAKRWKCTIPETRPDLIEFEKMIMLHHSQVISFQ